MKITPYHLKDRLALKDSCRKEEEENEEKNINRRMR